MGKLSLSQKATRMLEFLLGMRNGRIVAWVRPFGFTDAEYREGWSLLGAVGRAQLDVAPEEPTYDPVTLRQADDWENKWFVIADATLTRHAPDAHAWLFKNLSQTEGAAVVVSVGTFVERWENLDKAESGAPKSGKAAKKKLAERGLTKAVIDEAKGLLQKLAEVSGPVPNLPDLEADAEQIAKAEEAMWAWYLEWSRIARKVIRQRSLLRQLGFLRTTSSGGEEVVEDEETGTDEPETPEKPPVA